MAMKYNFKGADQMTAQLDAALALIQPHTAISVGGGRHMQQLLEAIHTRKLAVQLASPSAQTRAYGAGLGLAVAASLPHYALAFDGCDSVDHELNLLKSNGGIFTYEQLAAANADQYVILVAAAKYTPQLDARVPLTVECLAAAVPLVLRLAKGAPRAAATYMGATYTQDGNVLVDLTAASWAHLPALNQRLLALPGVVATSFCAHAASQLLLEGTDGRVQVIRKDAQ